jgi:lysozyme family protein
MTKFDDLFQEVLAAEGGFVDHPADPGGATNYGISLRFLQDVYALHPKLYVRAFGTKGIVPSKHTIRYLQPVQARFLFAEFFYAPLRCAVFSRDVALCLVDFAYNAGLRQAVLTLQRAHNAVTGGGSTEATPRTRLEEDGWMGPKTAAAVVALVDTIGDDALLAAFSRLRLEFYKKVVDRKPQMSPFYNGWAARSQAEDTADLPPNIEGKTDSHG